MSEIRVSILRSLLLLDIELVKLVLGNLMLMTIFYEKQVFGLKNYIIIIIVIIFQQTILPFKRHHRFIDTASKTSDSSGIYELEAELFIETTHSTSQTQLEANEHRRLFVIEQSFR